MNSIGWPLNPGLLGLVHSKNRTTETIQGIQKCKSKKQGWALVSLAGLAKTAVAL